MEENKITITLSLSKEKKEEIQNNIFGGKDEINYKNLIIKKGEELHTKGILSSVLITIFIIYPATKILDEIQAY